MSLSYRRDIDGLRAVAVLAVTFFHLGSPLFPGGFSGVDVFFVISGFLIASIVGPEIDSHGFSFLYYLKRRAVRLLPAFVFVIAATVALAFALLLPSEAEELGRTLATVPLMAANFYFSKRYNYFSDDISDNLFIHMWSLSVEFQFYLLLPLLLVAISALKRNCGTRNVILVVCICCSLAVSLYWNRVDPNQSFYMLAARFWEFGVGIILAVNFRRICLSDGAKSLATVLGLALIFGNICFAQPNPSSNITNVVLAVVGSGLVIVGSNSRAGRIILGSTPLVFIGKISYSMYLWHWPVIVIYQKASFQTDLTGVEMLSLVLVSVCLGAATWFLIERPERHLLKRKTFEVLGGLGALLAMIAICGFSLRLAEGMWKPYSPEVIALSRFTQSYLTSDEFRTQYERRGKSCFLSDDVDGGAESYDRTSCLQRTVDGRALLLIGDSHAAQFTGPFIDQFSQYDVLPIQAVGCRPLKPFRGTGRCVELMQFAFEDVVAANPDATIVLAARWTKAEERRGRSTLLADLRSTIEFLYSSGARDVVVLGPTVEYTKSLPTLLARSRMLGKDAVPDYLSTDIPDLSQAMQRVTVSAGGTFIDLYSMNCDGNHCRTENDGQPVLFDSNHVTNQEAALLARKIFQVLEAPAQP